MELMLELTMSRKRVKMPMGSSSGVCVLCLL
jgi:hypothetical protein